MELFLILLFTEADARKRSTELGKSNDTNELRGRFDRADDLWGTRSNTARTYASKFLFDKPPFATVFRYLLANAAFISSIAIELIKNPDQLPNKNGKFPYRSCQACNKLIALPPREHRKPQFIPPRGMAANFF